MQWIRRSHVDDLAYVAASDLDARFVIDDSRRVDAVDITAHSRFGHGVADTTLKMLPRSLDPFDHGFEVPIVVERAEQAAKNLLSHS